MTPTRNPGADFHRDWLRGLDRKERDAAVRAAEIEDRARERPDIAGRLRLAIRLLDLTTLAETDTNETIRNLCEQALRPVAPRPREREGARPLHVAAVCVYDHFVPLAREILVQSDVRVAAVTGGFPTPHRDRKRRVEEIRAAVEAGAQEIDVVITGALARRGEWPELYEEVSTLRAACGPAQLKAILRAGTLGSLGTVARAGLVCCMAGADFVKTSTGRERVNATLPIGLAMSDAVARYFERTAHAVGLKPAGGIRTAAQALAWLQLVEEELGDGAWLTPSRLRIGASSLLEDIRSRLGSPDGGVE